MLSKFLRKRDTRTTLADLIDLMGGGLGVYDESGKLLAGEEASGTQESILLEGQTLGYVSGRGAGVVAKLLMQALKTEGENKSLAREVLDNYRELNLLYNLAEKLATGLELSIITRVALEEASRLIMASDGVIFLYDAHSERLESVAHFGDVFDEGLHYRLRDDILSQVVRSGDGQLLNNALASDVLGDYPWDASLMHALIAAPLKSKGRVIGLLVISSRSDADYSAAHLKLLSTVASQAAPAIDNALLYEQTLREAKAREERLQRQIRSLRIELDEKKQQEQLNEITDSEYFQKLAAEAEDLRSIVFRNPETREF